VRLKRCVLITKEEAAKEEPRREKKTCLTQRHLKAGFTSFSAVKENRADTSQ
jgi:hypothetical protein